MPAQDKYRVAYIAKCWGSDFKQHFEERNIVRETKKACNEVIILLCEIVKDAYSCHESSDLSR